MASTNTIQRTVNYAQQCIRNAPLTGIGGFANEPAFSIGDWVRQFILTAPFMWRWNRSVVSFTVVAGFADYDYTNQITNSQNLTSGWGLTTGVTTTANFALAPDGSNTANRLQYDGSGSPGGVRLFQSAFGQIIPSIGVTFTDSIYLKDNSGTGPTISLANNQGGIQTVTLTNSWQRVVLTGTMATQGFPQIDLVSTDNSVLDILVWGAQLEFMPTANGYLATNTTPTNAFANMSFIEQATISDGDKTYSLSVKLNLLADDQENRPISISPVLDNNGNVIIRLLPTPEKPYQVTIDYQKAAPNFASLADTWAPIPDYYYYLILTGFLAKTFEYNQDDRFAPTMQMFVKQVVAASAGMSDTQKNIFLEEWIDTNREEQSELGNSASGRQGRSLSG